MHERLTGEWTPLAAARVPEDDMDEQTPGQPASDPESEPTMPAGGGAPAPSAADEALLALAQRLLAPRYPHMPAPEHDPTLLVGRLPDASLLEVPLPPGSRVVGSLVADDSITIVLDCDQPDMMALLDFYRERMAAQGWQVPEMRHPPHGGFTSGGGGVPLPYIHMCRGDRLADLQVTVLAREGQPTDLRLELRHYADPRHSPCAPQNQRPHFMPNVLPMLLPPTGAQQHSEGGNAGNAHASSTATVQTDLDPAALVAHFDQQLEKGGWMRADGGTAGLAGWSTWTLRDTEGQTWRGTLLVLRESDAPRQYFLMVRANLVGESKSSRGDGGTWSMSSMTIS